MSKVNLVFPNHVMSNEELYFSMPVLSQPTYCFCSLQELLCGTRDLSHVTSLEICVDTQENTLGNFGKINITLHFYTEIMAYFFRPYSTDTNFVCVLIRALSLFFRFIVYI